MLDMAHIVLFPMARQYQTISDTCLNSRCPGICTKSNSSEDCFCNARVMMSMDPTVVENYSCGYKIFTFNVLKLQTLLVFRPQTDQGLMECMQ